MVIAKPFPDFSVATVDPELADSNLKEFYSRFIGENASIRDFFAEAVLCASCKQGKLDVSFDTKCLAMV
jgi:hypothetical protein